MCILHHTENHMTLNTNKNLACTYLFGHCVVCLVIVCLSVCHPDSYVCTCVHYIHRCTQLKSVKLTLGLQQRFQSLCLYSSLK